MLNLSTIEELRNSEIIKLVECDKTLKEINGNVVRDTCNNKYYKIQQTNDEIKIELLNQCLKSLNLIKHILIIFSSIFILSIFILLFK